MSIKNVTSMDKIQQPIIEAEDTVLAECMWDIHGEALLIARQYLKKEYFSRKSGMLIFAFLCELQNNNQPWTEDLIIQHFDYDEKHPGMAEYIYGLSEAFTYQDCRHFSRKVAKEANKRQLRHAISLIIKSVYHPFADPYRIFNELKTSVQSYSARKATIQ
jgi:replicative DNA helicase